MTALREAIGKLDRAPLLQALEKADVPAGPVNALDEVLADEHTKARGLVGSFEHPVVGRFPALRLPLRYDGYENPEIGRPPVLGENTDEILRDMLGLKPEEIAALRAERVI